MMRKDLENFLVRCFIFVDTPYNSYLQFGFKCICFIPRHTQMKISIHGLVLLRVSQKVAQGRLRAYSKRISYKIILSKFQHGPRRAPAVITILLIASSNIDQSATSIRPRSL